MHSTTRQKLGSFNLKTVSAAVATALLFSNAHAAGLGKLTVLSSLGQPLRAEIELTTVSKDEAGAMVAKLASPEAFRQSGIDFNPTLSSLRFSVDQRGGRQVIRVTSAQPLNEPFVDLLLELSGPNGRLMREYTFLLDPPDLRTTQTAQVSPVPAAEAPAIAPRANVAAPTVQSVPAERPAAAARAAPPSEAKPVRQAAPAAKQESGTGEYQVKNGDTLAKIANQYKPGGVSLDQMLVALYQANPDAFAGNNMNRLKAGQILTVPSADTARSISKSDAHGIVVAQSTDFHNYRSKLAGQVATSAAQKAGETKQSAGGKITAKVEEKPTPANEAKDKLKLSNSAHAPGANADKSAGAPTAEDKIAKEKAVAEANARIKELEKNVTDLQKVLEVKNKNLAEQQKQAETAKADAKPAAPAAAAPAANAPVAAADNAKPDEAKTEKPAAEAATAPQASAPAESAPSAAAPKASAPAVKKPKTVVPPPPAKEPGFFDDLLDNPLVLPGLGALLVALGGLGIYSARRRKSRQFEDSIISDSSLKANSLFGSTGGQSVDTNNSVFNSSFTPSVSQLDSNEVDPVAEADVYIAYGRDAQAEEILKEALRTQPDRYAVRVKLLEIYSNRKDLRAFEVLATELYGLTKGEGEEWAQAAAMGAAIDPNNPLYASGKEASEPASAAGELVAPTQPMDDQGLATLLSTTQPDSSADEIDSLETDTSYFNNTALTADAPLEIPQEMPEEEAVAPALPEAKSESNDLEFDLEGMDLAKLPEAAPAEPIADLGSIDFDFLDASVKAGNAASELVPESKPEPLADLQLDPVPSLDDLEFHSKEEAAAKDAPLELPAEDASALEINLPELSEIQPKPEAKVESEPEAESLDFDLSGINLDLTPDEANATPDLAIDAHDDLPSLDLNTTSVDAEMATKLDLAIAYREIGDKEGARELLDEVMKGGSPEQSEKAKSLLLELA